MFSLWPLDSRLELLTFPEHMSSLLVISAIRVAQPLVFCVMLCRPLFVLLSLFLLFHVQFTAPENIPYVFSNIFMLSQEKKDVNKNKIPKILSKNDFKNQLQE